MGYRPRSGIVASASPRGIFVEVASVSRYQSVRTDLPILRITSWQSFFPRTEEATPDQPALAELSYNIVGWQ
jgi:hypothetical protein